MAITTRRNAIKIEVKEDPEYVARMAKEFNEDMNSTAPEHTGTCAGFEVPKRGVLKETKRILRLIAQSGVVFVETDDGLGQFVVQQVFDIAQSIGMHVVKTDYTLIVLDLDNEEVPSVNLY